RVGRRSIVAGPRQARRAEGHRAHARGHLNPVQAGSDQALRFFAMALGIKLARAAIVVAIFALWEALSRSGIVNPRLLPAASDTLSTLSDLLQRASVRKDLVVTATEVLTACALAVPVGTLIGFLIAENRHFADVPKPFLRL